MEKEKAAAAIQDAARLKAEEEEKGVDVIV